MGERQATVEAIDVRVYQIPTQEPEADGTATWDSTTMVMVLVTGAGHTGLGWTYGSAAGATLIRDTLADLVTARSVLDPTAVYHALRYQVRNVGAPGIAATAISAVDTALWDLKARVLGVRLARLLGVVRSDGVPVYGSGGFTTYDDRRLAEQLTGWVQDQGIGRVKIKIGESGGTRVDRDERRTRNARQIVGPGPELYVDANGGYRAKQAIRVAGRLADADVRWFEEPVSSDDLAGLRAVRSAVLPDVAAGEYGYSLSYFQDMCRAGAVDCLQADVTRCGGISEWQRVTAVAASHGLEISGHCAPALHLDAALATVNLRHLEWFADHVRIESMFFDGMCQPVGGVLRPDLSAEGNGLTLREPDAERYRIA